MFCLDLNFDTLQRQNVTSTDLTFFFEKKRVLFEMKKKSSKFIQCHARVILDVSPKFMSKMCKISIRREKKKNKYVILQEPCGHIQRYAWHQTLSGASS